MQKLLPTVAVLLVGSVSIAQAKTDLIYYPFLNVTGPTVRNLYAGTGNPVPATGNFVSTNTNGPWVPAGRTGPCMRGKDVKSTSTYNYIDTGWKGGLTGSMTIAWFMKLRTDLGFLSNNLPNIGYFITGNGSFRMFTGGVANKGFILRAWGGQPADIYLGGGAAVPHTGYDLHAAAKNAWVHVALVVDPTAGTAIYYVDGAPKQTTNITGSLNLPVSAGNNFRVGAHTSLGTAFNYDVDEFRLLNRAATPAEIQSWAMAYLQTDKTDLSMRAVDSQNFTLQAGAGNRLKQYWIFGSITGTSPGVPLGPVTIPLRPDPYTNLTIAFANSAAFTNTRGILDASGNAKASLNLPRGYNDPQAIGTRLYHAYIVYDAAGYYLASNPVEARIVQ